MTHPTPEEIKVMLIIHTPTPVQYVVDAYRALLEENKRLNEQLTGESPLTPLIKLQLELERVKSERNDLYSELRYAHRFAKRDTEYDRDHVQSILIQLKGEDTHERD